MNPAMAVTSARCSYVHIGEILPNNFICPLCGRGKDDFDPIFKEEIEN